MTFIQYTPPKPKCASAEHSPPMYMVYKPGQYTYKCPQCGYETTFCVAGMKW